MVVETQRKGISKGESEWERDRPGEISPGKVLRCKVRYFTDGAVIGSRSIVNDAFARARERFGSKRKSGARKPRGGAAGANRFLWSLRDLKKGIA
jgi:putative transposase